MEKQTFAIKIALLICAALYPALKSHAKPTKTPVRVAVWDTGPSTTKRLTSDQWAQKDGWERKTGRQKASAFLGDAVMSNGRVLAVLCKQGVSVDVYGIGGDEPILRAQLRLQSLAGDPATRLKRVVLVENTRAAVRLEATFQTTRDDSITAGFRLKRGGIFVEARPGPGAGGLRVESPGRFVVLPDFFADDILIDAAKIPVAKTEIPSENLLMHLTGDGNAIAMCVFENSDQDVRVTFEEEGGHRYISGSEIRFGEQRKIWVALLESPGIWHAFDVMDDDGGKIKPLSWRTPFAAQWRVDFSRQNDLVDSWEMVFPTKDRNGYVKASWLPSSPNGGVTSKTASGEVDVDAYQQGGPASERLGLDRKRWTTVLGRFEYPCWTDHDGQGHVQPLKHDKLTFAGPGVIYPINRLPGTPIDQFTAVDVLRDTLGVGPCEYILKVESQQQDHVGRATCHVRRLLNEIYENKQQKDKRLDIETYLSDGMDFVKHIRQRISEYIQFGHEMHDYLDSQKKAHPELEESLSELESIVGELDERLEARRNGIKTISYVAQLNDGFRDDLLSYDGPDTLDRLKAYTDRLTQVGGEQDELVGECRWIVRSLRQRAALAMATDPRFADIAREIRARTQLVLLKPAAYEGARH